MVHDQSSHPRSVPVCNNFPIHHTIFSLFWPTLSLSHRHFPFFIFIVILFLSLSDNEFSFSSIFLIFTHMVAFNIQFFLMLRLQFLVKLCGFLTVRWKCLTKYVRSLRTTGTRIFGFLLRSRKTHYTVTSLKVLSHDILKELSHEIGMGYLWYGWKEPYLKMNLC
jgi:hypothetical protein